MDHDADGVCRTLQEVGAEVSQEEIDEATKKLLRDPKMLRLLRNLCPKKGSGMTITISGASTSTTLTEETRARLNAKLRRTR